MPHVLICGMRFDKILFLLICLGLFASTSILSQIQVSGKVIDSSNGETIIGAIVSIGERGTATDIDGFFRINGISKGSQIIQVEYLSFEKFESSLQLQSDTIITISMTPAKATQVGEVEVISNRRTGTESSVLMEIRDAAGVASGLSAKQISKNGELLYLHIQQFSTPCSDIKA